jgi:hypothetical protein
VLPSPHAGRFPSWSRGARRALRVSQPTGCSKGVRCGSTEAANVFVSENLLDRSEVGSDFEEVGGERGPKAFWTKRSEAHWVRLPGGAAESKLIKSLCYPAPTLPRPAVLISGREPSAENPGSRQADIHTFYPIFLVSSGIFEDSWPGLPGRISLGAVIRINTVRLKNSRLEINECSRCRSPLSPLFLLRIWNHGMG